MSSQLLVLGDRPGHLTDRQRQFASGTWTRSVVPGVWLHRYADACGEMVIDYHVACSVHGTLSGPVVFIQDTTGCGECETGEVSTEDRARFSDWMSVL